MFFWRFLVTLVATLALVALLLAILYPLDCFFDRLLAGWWKEASAGLDDIVPDHSTMYYLVICIWAVICAALILLSSIAITLLPLHVMVLPRFHPAWRFVILSRDLWPLGRGMVLHQLFVIGLALCVRITVLSNYPAICTWSIALCGTRENTIGAHFIPWLLGSLAIAGAIVWPVSCCLPWLYLDTTGAFESQGATRLRALRRVCVYLGLALVLFGCTAVDFYCSPGFQVHPFLYRIAWVFWFGSAALLSLYVIWQIFCVIFGIDYVIPLP